MVDRRVFAQQPPVARTPQQAALVDLTGNWVSVVTEEWLWRMTTPRKGDYTSIPLSDEGRRVADRWDSATEGSCQAYGAGGLMRIPMRLRISWRGDDAIAVETDAGQQTRLLRFDRTPPAGARSLQGHSMAEWEPIGGPPVVRSGRPGPAGAPRGGALKVVTTNLSEGWLRPNGVAYSESTSLLEYLGPRDLPQRRHLADRHLRRQRSALPREGLHDERALQAGSGRLEVETGTLSHVIQNAEFRMQTLTHRTLVATIAAILAAASLTAPSLAQGPGPAQPAMVELAGSWTMSNEEELLIRVDPGPELGNFTGFPLNAAGRQKALSWNSTIQAVPEHQARPHPAQVLDARARSGLPHERGHRSGVAPAHRLHDHRSLRKREPHDLAGRPSASVRVRRASLERVLDRRVGERDAEGDDDAHEAGIPAAQRHSEQSVRGDDRVLHPPRQPADDDLAGGRSDLPRGADDSVVNVAMESRDSASSRLDRSRSPKNCPTSSLATCRTTRSAHDIRSMPMPTDCRSRPRSVAKRRCIPSTSSV